MKREYEVHPARIVESHPDDPVKTMEQCDWDDPSIECWSVYEHLNDPNDPTVGGLECIRDFPTKVLALEFYHFVQQAPENERVLRDDEILEMSDTGYRPFGSFNVPVFEMTGLPVHVALKNYEFTKVLFFTRKEYDLLEVSPPCALFTLTMYGRREPTDDPDIIKYAPKSKRCDVILSKSPGGPACARIPWHYKGIPTRSKKTVMYNCTKYQLIWTNDKGELL